MRRRIEDAIAQLESLGHRLTGRDLQHVRLIVEILRPKTAAERQRASRLRRATDPPDVTKTVTQHVTPDVTQNVTQIVTPAPSHTLPFAEGKALCSQQAEAFPEKQSETKPRSESSSPSSSLLTAQPNGSAMSQQRDATRVTRTPNPRRANAEPSRTDAVWRAYRTAYALRYGIEPERNARVNSQIAQFCKRIAAEHQIATVEHYVRSQNARYIAAGHSTGCLLQDAEKLRTEALTGRSATLSAARRLDITADRAVRHEAVLRRLEAEDAAEAEKDSYAQKR